MLLGNIEVKNDKLSFSTSAFLEEIEKNKSLNKNLWLGLKSLSDTSSILKKNIIDLLEDKQDLMSMDDLKISYHRYQEYINMIFETINQLSLLSSNARDNDGDLKKSDFLFNSLMNGKHTDLFSNIKEVEKFFLYQQKHYQQFGFISKQFAFTDTEANDIQGLSPKQAKSYVLKISDNPLHQIMVFHYVYHRQLAKQLLAVNPEMGKVFLATLKQLNKTGTTFESLLTNENFFPFFLSKEDEPFLFTKNQHDILLKFGKKEAMLLANTYFTIKNNIILKADANQRYLATLLLNTQADEEILLDKDWLNEMVNNFIVLKMHIEPFLLSFHEGSYANSFLFYETVFPLYALKTKNQSAYSEQTISEVSKVLMVMHKNLPEHPELSAYAYSNLTNFLLNYLESSQEPISAQKLYNFMEQKIDFSLKHDVFSIRVSSNHTETNKNILLSVLKHKDVVESIENLSVDKKLTIKKPITQLKKDVFKLFNDSEIEKINYLLTNSDHKKMLASFFEKDKLEKAQNKTASLIQNKDILEEKITTLRNEFPNFLKVIDYIEKQCLLALKGDKKFYFHPILLLGEPGLGKTFFSHRMAELFDIHYEAVHFETTTANFTLTGGDSQWTSAKMGVLAKTLLTQDNINPLFLLDEIDKSIGNAYPAINSLYSLLERNTARTFEDEFLKIKMDLSFVNYIATANYISSIPEPLLNRVNVFEINVPNKEQSIIIAKNIYKNILKNESWGDFFEKELDISSFEELCLFAPRQMNGLITEALGNAVVADRNYLVKDDFDFNKKTANLGFKF